MHSVGYVGSSRVLISQRSFEVKINWVTFFSNSVLSSHHFCAATDHFFINIFYRYIPHIAANCSIRHYLRNG